MRHAIRCIVYILTDDQDVKLGSLDVLPVVKSLLTEQGLYFDNAFVTTPVCCPSRFVVLIGQKIHRFLLESIRTITTPMRTQYREVAMHHHGGH